MRGLDKILLIYYFGLNVISSHECGNIEHMNRSLSKPIIVRGGQVQILDHWKFWWTDKLSQSTKGTFGFDSKLPGFDIIRNEDIVNLDSDVIFIILHDNYFHFIHETLFMLESLRLHGLFTKVTNPMILNSDASTPWFANELFRLFQFKFDTVKFQTALPGVGYRVTENKSLIIPYHKSKHSPAVHMNEYLDNQYVLMKSLKSRLKVQNNNPSQIIYISRKHEKRNIPQEDELLVLLKASFPSLKIVSDIGKLWVEEQQKLFADAKIVIAPHGAALTNMIFSNWQKVILIEITGVSKGFSFHSWLLVEHHYVIWTKQIQEGEFSDPNFIYYGEAPLDIEVNSMARLITKIIRAPKSLKFGNATWGSCTFPKMSICYSKIPRQKITSNNHSSMLTALSCPVNKECNQCP